MKKLTPRKIEVLKIIIEEFLKTGEVIGSKSLLKRYDLGVSSATIRNDMAELEILELIYQPYNSAGRLPTAKGLRAFVSYLMEEKPDFFLSAKNVDIDHSTTKKLEDKIYTVVRKLGENTREIAFFCIPDDSINKYFGLAYFLEKNFLVLGETTYDIISMIEDKYTFMKFIEALPMRSGVNIFIGEEGVIGYLKDYTIIVRPIQMEGKIGYIGIIGSLKMDYSYNISAVRGII